MAKTYAELPAGTPEREAERHELLAWINAACVRDHNRIVAVHRSGTALDAYIRFDFENGARTDCRQRELFSANGLRMIMMGVDGTPIPGYSGADCQQVAARLIWTAETTAQDDEADQLRIDCGQMLQYHLTSGGLLRDDWDANGYRMVADLARINRARAGFNGQPAALALDQSKGVLWVPRGALIGYLRDHRAVVNAPRLRMELELFGWQRVDLHRRQPQGQARAKAKVWMLDADWEGCPFDLSAAIEVAPAAFAVGAPKPSPAM